MQRIALICLLYLMSTLTLMASDNNKEHRVWDKVPIAVDIAQGFERIISFPDRISVKNIDNNLTTDKVNIINNQGTLYIKAKKEFAPVRIAVSLQKTGEVILLDIAAKENVANIPIEIVLKENLDNINNTNANTNPNPNNGNDNNNTTSKFATDYVTLVRAAIQELYAPLRLREEVKNIKRTPMYTENSIALFWDLQVISLPVASWTANGFYVTAVLIKNTSKKTTTLNLDAIRGNWIAASFYPNDELTKAGSKNDRTTLFLVANQPFGYAYQTQKEVT